MKRMKCIIAGAASLLAFSAAGLPAAQSSLAAERGENATVTYGDYYKAVFHHKGETLDVYDWKTDGKAAVAYVQVWNRPGGDKVDEDTFRMTETHKTYNLGTPDGSGNIPEGYKVIIKVCKGDSDHCSGWRHAKA